MLTLLLKKHWHTSELFGWISKNPSGLSGLFFSQLTCIAPAESSISCFSVKERSVQVKCFLFCTLIGNNNAAQEILINDIYWQDWNIGDQKAGAHW